MKKSRLKQTAMEVTVGTFILMMLLLLGFFTIILSRESIFVKNYQVSVLFDNVTGLITGDKVYVQGVDVGRVKAMDITERGVQVVLSLKYKPNFHEDYSVSVEPSSILGGKFVSVNEGSRDAAPLPDQTELVGRGPVDFIGETTDTIKSIRDAMEEGGILNNLTMTMTNIAVISEKIKNGEGTFGKLVNDDALYNEVKDAASSLREITAKIQKGEGTVGRLVNDDSVYTNVQQIVANLKDVTDRLAEGKGTLGKLMAEDDKLYNDLSDAVASIKSISGSIDRGEGTIGKLARDEELYTELRKMIEEVRAAIDDVRETSPVSTFSGIFFGAF
ncbi:MAG: MlaD family protein [bacterium]